MSWKLQIAAFVGLALGQPANDNCTGALSILDGVVSGNTSGATVEGNLTDDVLPCLAYYNDIWFSYTASCSGIAAATVSGACDLVLASWAGDCSHFNSHSCEDQAGVNEKETLYFRATQNTSYLISVADYSLGCSGAINLNMSCTQSPENNICDTALTISDGFQTGLTNIGSTVPAGVVSPCNASYFHDVWFVYNATCTGKTTIEIANNEADLEVVSWAGTDCNSLVGLVCGDTGEARENDRVTFASVEGGLAYVSVAGFSFLDFADFDLTVTCVPTPPAPVNDKCSGARAMLSDVNTVGTLSGATHSPNATSCSSDADVWFTYTAPCTGTATIVAQPSCATDDITLQLWGSRGCVGAVAGVCVDSGTPTETKQFLVEKNMSYLFLVGSKVSDPYSGSLTLSASCDQAPPPPDNDQCSGAYWAVDGPNNAANWGATTGNRSTGCVSMNSDVWFRYVANCTGLTTARLSNENDEVIVAWTGSTCNSLVSYQCAHNGPVQFPTVRNSTYYISIGSYDVYQGPLLLSVSCSIIPPTMAPTLKPTAAPTAVSCPDFKSFLGNCSSTNFTNNAQCSAACSQAALHVFDGTNLTTSTKVDCLAVVNQTWNYSSATTVLGQRLNAGNPLCRSAAFRAVWAWIPLCVGLALL